MTDISIPAEALEAAAEALFLHKLPNRCWETVPDFHKEWCREEASTAIAAALSAWPGMMMALTTDRGVRCLVDPSDATHIILPLPPPPEQEPQNGKFPLPSQEGRE